VTRSRYYAWARAAHRSGEGERHREEATLVAAIGAIHTDSAGTSGSPRVHAELGRRGWRVNHKRVERLMRAHGIVGHRPRRRRSLTKPDAATAPPPDLLERLFDPDQPGCRLVRGCHLHPHRRGLAIPSLGHRPGLPAPARRRDGHPP
jgi:putative transposase